MNFGKLQETQENNKLGVGLGLSICREIILAQGGSIDIQSEEGKGTAFIITLKAKVMVDNDRVRQAQIRYDTLGSDYQSSQNNSNSNDEVDDDDEAPDKDDGNSSDSVSELSLFIDSPPINKRPVRFTPQRAKAVLMLSPLEQGNIENMRQNSESKGLLQPIEEQELLLESSVSFS